MKKIVLFTGAGVSAESGLKTFRDSDGLWEEYNVMEVATPEGWEKNPKLVLEFYNKRRKQLLDAKPNAAHYAIASLENKFEVQIITQNIDNLHERAGSTKIVHLHGELLKARSSAHPDKIYDIDGWELNWGDCCEIGTQLRPHVVWFGEAVPNMDIACNLIRETDILIVIGTSLNVYPAAGLIHYAPVKSKKFLIDPNDIHIPDIENLVFIQEKASKSVPILVEKLLNDCY